jgi:hypothetical protein
MKTLNSLTMAIHLQATDKTSDSLSIPLKIFDEPIKLNLNLLSANVPICPVCQTFFLGCLLSGIVSEPSYGLKESFFPCIVMLIRGMNEANLA